MPNNAPHNALRAAVARSIANGAPVYTECPAHPGTDHDSYDNRTRFEKETAAETCDGPARSDVQAALHNLKAELETPALAAAIRQEETEPENVVLAATCSDCGRTHKPTLHPVGEVGR